MRFLLTLLYSLIIVPICTAAPILFLVVSILSMQSIPFLIMVFLLGGFLWFLSIWFLFHLWKLYIENSKQKSNIEKYLISIQKHSFVGRILIFFVFLGILFMTYYALICFFMFI